MARLSFRLHTPDPQGLVSILPRFTINPYLSSDISTRYIHCSYVTRHIGSRPPTLSHRRMLHRVSQALGKSSFRSHPSLEATHFLPCAPKPLYQRVYRQHPTTLVLAWPPSILAISPHASSILFMRLICIVHHALCTFLPLIFASLVFFLSLTLF